MVVRRRIGLLVPSTNSTGEPDFHMTVPDGVSVHSHHLWLDTSIVKPETIDGMNSELAQGARYLAPLLIEVICMAGTTNSFYKGLSGSTWMENQMREAAGVPAIASSPSVAMALSHFGAKRISVATPYPKWSNERLKDYFTAAGLTDAKGHAYSKSGGEMPEEPTTDSEARKSCGAGRMRLQEG